MVDRRLTIVAVMAALFVAVGCGGEASKDRADPRPAATLAGVDSGELVDVGGRQLYVECVGSGTPTVLLEAGFGRDSQDWTDVLQELGKTTRTCAYDRAGIGVSEPIAGVHDAGDEIRDLERLLDRGRIEPPYVLVGHSYGGLLARLFARAHPDQTGGVVLVDSVGRDPMAPRIRRLAEGGRAQAAPSLGRRPGAWRCRPQGERGARQRHPDAR